MEEKKSGRKVATQLTLSPDVRAMLDRQAAEKGISLAAYVERLILEKDWERKYLQRQGAENRDGKTAD